MSEVTKDDLISRHIFLFPFKWEIIDKKGKGMDGFGHRTDIETFHNIITDGNESSTKAFKWERNPFELPVDIANYNEYNYYYDFVREILYDLGKHLKSMRGDNSEIIRHYELKSNGLPLLYSISLENRDDPYVLELDSTLLNVYSTGVAVLVFFLANRQYGKPDDILAINQYGRRLYPPFFELDQEKIGKSFEQGADFKKGLKGVAEKVLAKRISILPDKDSDRWKELMATSGAGYKNIHEDFGNYADPGTLKEGPFSLPAFISKLLPNDGKDILTKEPAIDLASQAKQVFISPVLDDRMFVVCWYGGLGEGNALNDTIDENSDLQVSNKEKFLYKFTFVDAKDPSVYDTQFFRKVFERHSYKRWNPYTYYGVSRYSFVCLTSPLSTLREKQVNAAFLAQHIETIYYKLVELALVQRASVLRFSDEITHLVGQKFDMAAGGHQKSLTQKIQDLYWNYIRFRNKIFFREATHQEQGIELYDLIQEHMRVEKDVKELDQEINELHNYVTLTEEKRRNDRLELITVLGAAILLPTFIAGFWGMNIVNSDFVVSDELLFWYAVSLHVLGVLIALSIPRRNAFFKRKIFRVLSGFLAILLTILLFLGPFAYKAWC